jgi:septal ring factor EnvC (AmiA/AmiB activator)
MKVRVLAFFALCMCTYIESTTGPYRRDNDQLTSRLRYTELQLNEAREQMKAKDEALTRAQAELTKHQRTSASFESTLTKSRQTSTETEQSLRIEVATLQEHLLNLGADSERVRAELVVIQAQLAQVRQAKDMDDKSHADQMQQLQRSLNDSRTLLRRAETSLSEVRPIV